MTNRPRLIATILGMGLCSFLLAGCGWRSGETNQEETKQDQTAHAAMEGSQTMKSQAMPPSDAPKRAATEVVIDNFTFEPPMLTINAGAEVTWINHDDVPHTATSSTKPRVFDSGTLDTDQRFSHVFATPGTYDYFCAVHPKMTGRIIVK